MKYSVLILVNLLLFMQPLSSVFAREPLKENLEEFMAGVQRVIEQTEPVFQDDILLQWAKLTFGIRHMTYIVDTRNPEKTLGVVTFTCKVTQSDFFETREEAEQAPVKNMIPRLIPCQATYEWKADRWEYTGGATYIRGGDWKPIPTDKPDAFPQLYFDLMKGPSPSSLSLPSTQEEASQERSSQALTAETAS